MSHRGEPWIDTLLCIGVGIVALGIHWRSAWLAFDELSELDGFDDPSGAVSQFEIAIRRRDMPAFKLAKAGWFHEGGIGAKRTAKRRGRQPGYLGIHWPTDDLAGWRVGAAWAVTCWAVALGFSSVGQSNSRLLKDHSGALAQNLQGLTLS